MTVLGLLSGCASVDYTPISTCNASDADIKILTAAPPEGTFRVCGSLSVNGSRFTSTEDANGLYLQQARKYGANAIVPVSGLEWDFNWAEGNNKKAKALAIQISSPSAIKDGEGVP